MRRTFPPSISASTWRVRSASAWRPWSGRRILNAPPPMAIRRMTVIDASVVRRMPVTLRNASTARAVRASKCPFAPVTYRQPLQRSATPLERLENQLRYQHNLQAIDKIQLAEVSRQIQRVCSVKLNRSGTEIVGCI